MLDIYVINIKEREDRFNSIKQKFAQYKNINIIQIDAIKHEKGVIGCFLSHKKCIQFAKDNSMKNIIVIEDDCEIIDPETFEEKIINLKKYLDDNDDWYIFLGGVFHLTYLNLVKKVDNNLYQINSGYCTHFIIYNHKSYDTFLNADETKSPIDHIWQNKFPALIIIPFIATQSDSYSNINNSFESSYRRRIKITNIRLSNWINYSKLI